MSLPPGYKSPDYSHLEVMVNAASWSLFAVSTGFLVLRLWTRIKHGGGLWTDDWLMLAGWVFLAATGAILSWVSSYFFESMMGRSYEISINLSKVHHNLQSIALALTKTSFGATLLRLLPRDGWEKWVVWVLLITMNIQFLVHFFMIWLQGCGVNRGAYLPGGACWRQDQTVVFAVFSALYSAFCDFVLALLPWKMIFNLQVKKEERIGIALALSLGVLAGVTGVLKGVQAVVLQDLRSPDYLHNQAVYWVWSMAEPNVTIISATMSVLRSFIRKVRKQMGATSTPSGERYGGAYYKTGGGTGTGGTHNNTLFNRNDNGMGTRSRVDANDYPLGKDADVESDKGILPPSNHPDDHSKGHAIQWTHEVHVDYEDKRMGTRDGQGSGESGFELSDYPHGADPRNMTTSATSNHPRAHAI